MEFKNILQAKRKEAGLTQETLAEKLFVSSKTISNWETGKTTPDIDNLIRLSNILQISLNDLLLEGSDMVENIKKSAEIRETKIYFWCSYLTNLVFLAIILIKEFVTPLPAIVSLLVSLGIIFNFFVAIYFSKKLDNLTQSGWKYWTKKKKIVCITLIIIIGIIISKYYGLF